MFEFVVFSLASRSDDVVDGGGLGRAAAEGCGERVDGVSPFRMRDVYAFLVARCGVGEGEAVGVASSARRD